MDQDKILAVRKILTESDNIVFFGGAFRISAPWTACTT